MLVDPLDTFDAFLNRPLGCIAVSISASLFSAVLWLVDKHTMKGNSIESKRHLRRSNKLESVRDHEVITIHGCLKLLWVASGLFALTYLGRALILK